MKKLFTLLTLFVLSIAQATAQIEVTATAGSTGPSTYTTMSAAFGAINAGTHQGAITILVKGNTTEPQTPLSLLASAGSSNYSSVLIRPFGGNWTINSNGSPLNNRGIIELYGADNVTIDGDDPLEPGTRNLSFTMATSSNTGTACIRVGSVSTDGATNINIKNCNIVGGRLNATSTLATFGIAVSGSTSSVTATGSNNTQVTIENNAITRAFRGIFVNGAAATPFNGLVVKDNIIGSANSADNVAIGINIGGTSATAGVNSAIIEKNDIRGGDYANGGFASAISGIEVGANNHGIIIRKNNIHDIMNPISTGRSTAGILIAGTSNGIYIYNNIIRDIVSSKFDAAIGSSSQNYGIRITNTASTDVKINYNTIALQQLNTVGTQTNEHSSCIVVASGTVLSEFINNNLVNSSTSTNAYGVTTLAPSAISTATMSNNNYSIASGNIGYYNALTYNTIATWQGATSKDAGSLTETPYFVSSTDLHIDTTNPNSVNFNNKGVPVAGVSDDYDGETRSLTLPDIGADEFNIAVCASPLSSGSILPTTVAKCLGTTQTFNVSGASSGNGISYQWQVSSTSSSSGFSDVVGGSGSNTANYTTASLSSTGTTYYRLRIICSLSNDTTYSSAATLSVYNLPNVQVNSSVFSYCHPGGVAVNLVASGADSYTWTPADGLNSNTGASVSASPSVSTTYTVTGVNTLGSCSATAVTTVTVNGMPMIQSLTASPTILCGGNSGTLSADVYAFQGTNAGLYQFESGSGASLDPMIGATTIVNAGVDDINSAIQSLPFNFNFNNSSYNTYVASPNGWMMFGGPGVTQSNNVTVSSTNIPKLFPYWDDLATGSNGWIKNVTTGTAPNRIHKIEWKLAIPLSLATPANSTFQVWLYENTNKIEYRYGAMGTPGGSSTASAGLTGSPTQFQSITFATNSVSNSTPNDLLNSVPASGTVYSFNAPNPVLSYNWEPSAYLSNSNYATTSVGSLTANETFTLTVNNAGCETSDTITIGYAAGVVCGAITSSNGTNICLGTTTQLTANASVGGTPYTYLWAPSTGLSSTSIANPIASPTTNTTYTVTVTDNCGTTCSTTITINVQNAPAVTASTSSAVYCFPGGVGVNLNAGGAVSYSWTPSTGLSNASISNPVANPTTSTIYTVVGSDANGCTATSTVNLVVSSALAISATATPSTICLGNTSQLNFSIPTASNYCTPIMNTGCANDYISNVTIAGINRNSTCDNLSGSNGYSYLSSFTGTLVAGSTANAYSIKTGGDVDGASAWIDFNQDGIFSANENIFNGFLGTNPATYAGTFNVPANAINGTTRLRVRSLFNANPGANSACNTYTFGETEDYPIVISGGFNQPVFSWNNGATLSSTTITNPVATPNLTTNYVVTVTDGAGCTYSTSAQVNVITNLPQLTVNTTNPLCNGGNGTITFSTSIGSTPYTYTVNGSTQTSPYAAVAGTYTIAVTDANTCGTQSVVTITEPSPLILNAYTVNALCNGASGTINFSATGGTGAIAYTVNGTTQTSPYTAAAGSYTVVATDANGCSTSSVLVILSSSEILLSTATVDPTCNGGNGSITFSATGGKVGPYAYIVNRTSNNVTVVNTNNNTTVTTIPVGNYPTAITISHDGHRAYVTNVQSNSVSVINTMTNAVIATVPTGNGPIGVAVSPDNSKLYVANNPDGSITVVNAATNTVLNTIAIGGQPQGLAINNDGSKLYVANFASNTVQVINTANSTISNTINFPANSKPYGIILNPTGTKLYTSNFQNNTVSEINTANNTIVNTIAVGQRPVPLAITSNGNTLYVGNSLDNNLSVINTATAAVTNTIAVGTTPRGLDLLPNNSSLYVSNIGSNNVSVINTSTNTVTNTIAGFNAPASFGKFITYVHGNDSTINYQINGVAATSPYTATAGTYTIVATDNVNCTKSAVVTIGQPVALTFTTSVSNPACNGNNGTLTFAANGGTGAISYTVNGVTATSPFSGLAGTYTISATDANNCSASTVMTLTNPAILTISGSSTNALCNGATGSLTFGSTGGTGTITYTVNGTTQTSPFTTIAGNYTVIATDANNCTASTVLTIAQPTAISLSATANNATCNGGNGSITFSANGGTGSITYNVNGATQTSPFTAVAGTYTIEATDANNCTSSTVVTINEPSAISISLTTNNALCNAANGSLVFSASGGTGSFTYKVNGATQTSPFAASAGTYTIVATDVNNCSSSTTTALSQPTALSLSATNTDALCFGANGSLSFSATGGTGSINYTVNGTSQTSPFATVAGTYTIVATDANACSTTTTVTIAQPAAAVSISVLYTANPTCDLTGIVIVSANGGTGAKTFSISPAVGVQVVPGTFSSLTAGTYTITATDINNCTSTTVVNMVLPPFPVITVTGTTPILCNGGTSTITVSGSSGTAPLLYSFNGGTYSSNTTFTGNLAGVYNITVKDANGCTMLTSVTVTQPSALSLNATSNNAICYGGNGQISFNATGGTGSISYTVNGTNQVSPITPVAGSYTIVATDANNCSVSTVAVVTQPTPVVLNASATNPICYGNNGSLLFNASGGTGIITYTVNGVNHTSPYSTQSGTYTIVATDANACSASTVVVMNQPSLIVVNTTHTSIACFGGTSNLTATATGGNGLLFYSLDGVNFQSSGIFNNLTAGTYTITSKDGANCSVTSLVTITQPDLLVVNATVNNALCQSANGTINFSTIGGTGIVSYTVNGTAQTSPYTTVAGTYTIVATDANNCTASTVATISQPTAVSLSASASNALCNGANGSLIFGATGGTGTINYTVNGTAQTSPFATVAGTYTIVATDANSCTASSVVTISQPTTVSLSASSANALCNGANGSLTFSATGGTGTINYTVNGTAQTSPFATVAGTYTIVATDANNCTASTVATISQPTAVSISASPANALCNGANGSLTFSATGGTGTINYTVNGTAQTSPFATVAGTYTIVATDANSCTASSVVTISQPTAVSLSASSANALCNGANGSLTFGATGGTGTINYTVNGTAQTSPYATVAGTYTIIATDVNSCTASSVVTINEPTAVNLNASATNALCNGANGSLTFSATGGTGIINYTVNGNAQTSPFATVAGTYTIVATDANSCTASSVVTISQPTAVSLSASSTNALCNGANGSLTFSATGGTGTINYTVNGTAQTSPFATVAGTYTIVATDANSCTVSSVLTITEPTAVSLSASSANALCNGANGSLTFSATGGTGTINYTVNGTAQTSPFATVAGTYTIVATDANSCTASSVLTITEPTAVSLNASSANALCNGANGSLTFSATGGTGTINYTVNGTAQTSPFATVAGTYTIVATDANSCTASSVVTISQPTAVSLSASSANALCNGANGSLTFGATGGTGTINYTVNGTAQTSSFATIAGTYTIVATDANNCTASSVVTINEPSAVSLSASASDALCFAANGSLTFGATGGTGAITYTVNGSVQTSPFATIAGTYTVIATDVNNCSASSVVTINEPSIVGITASSSNALCNGANGSLTFNGNGGTTPYTYTVNGGAQTSPFATIAGTYTVVVSDANNCTASTTLSITEPTAVFLTASPSNALCNGASGTISFSAVGGTGTIAYTVNGTPQNSPYTATPGTYTIVATDANNCSSSSVIIISQSSAISMSASVTDALCNGADGSLIFSATGGNTGPYAYIVNRTSNNVSVLNTNNNSVIATIPVGTYPSGIAVSPNGQHAYVTNDQSNSVSVINTTSNTVVATIPTGTQPIGVVVSPNSSKIYVANYAVGTISVIDALTNTVSNTINVGGNPYGLTINSDGSRVYVANFGSNNVQVLNTNTMSVLNTITYPANSKPYAVLLNPSGTKLYSANFQSNSVSEINTSNNTISSTVPVGNTPVALTIHSNGNSLYVSNRASNNVSVINTQTFTVTNTIAVGSTPRAIDISPSDSFVYVTNSASNNVSVINTTTNAVVNTIGGFNAPISFGKFVVYLPGTGAGITYTVNGSSAVSPFAAPAGTYTIVATDAVNCSASTTVTVAQPSAMVFTSSSVSPLCNGGQGTISFSVTGGTGTKTYTVDGVSATSPYAVGAGTYTVVATDANACTTSTIITVTEPSALALNTLTSDALCNAALGSIAYMANGGTGTISYTVNGVVASSPYSAIAGNYTVVATDANACSISSIVVINEPSAVVVSATSTDALCNGGNGSLTFSATGGTGSMIYTVNGVSQTSPMSTVAGTYTIVATDANSCTASSIATIAEPSAINLSASATDALCNTANGSLNFSATGGTGLISYTVNGTSQTSPYSTVAGTYTVSAIDANNCSVQTILTINEPSAVVVSGSSTPALCFGTNGSMQFAATGGTGSHTYTVNGSVQTSPYSALAGTYTVIATDVNACTGSTIITITEPLAPLQVSVTTSSNPTCVTSGFVGVTATGGTSGYTYTIDPIAGTQVPAGTFTGLSGGSYTITATDANGCTATTSITLAVPPIPAVAVVSATPILCNGNGSTLTLSGTGGTPPLEFNLNGGLYQSSNVFNNVVAGLYNISVRDSYGCTAVTVLNITQPTLVDVVGFATNALCNGANGSLDFLASGGTGTFTYTVNGISATSPYAVPAGTYTVVAQDANACTGSTVLTITEPTPVTVSINTTPIPCLGGTSTLTATGSGGNGIHFYSLDGVNFQSSGVFSNLSAGTYTVSCVDGYNCLVTSLVVITQPTQVNLSATAPTILCNNDQVVLTANANGGTGTYTYTLNGGTTQASNTFTVGAGSYTIVVSDVNNCSASTTISLTEPSALSMTSSSANALCNSANGTLNFNASGGTGIINYTVNNIPQVSPLATGAGTYTVVATDANACSISSVLVITEPSAIALTTSVSNALCNGANGSLSFGATGGTGAINFTVNGTAQTSPYIALAGTYTLVATDANACTASTVLTITEPSAVSLTASASNALCNAANGSLSFSAIGGTGAISYTVNGVSQSSPFATGAGTYTIVATDANACSSNMVLTITEPSAVTLTATATDALCNGINGSLNFNATGGTGVITYTVNGTIQTSPLAALAGTYTIVSTDANACSTSTVVTINQPTALAMTSSSINALCNGANGSLTFNATGGTGTISYTVNGTSQTSPFAVGAGTYTVVATDANACSISSVLVITEPATSVSLSLVNAANPTCNVNGIAVFAATGGTGALTYAINPNIGIQVVPGTFSSLPAGNYTVTATDVNGCTSTVTLSMVLPVAPAITLNPNNPILCNGGNTSITVSGAGGLAPYQFSLNGAAYTSNTTFNNVNAGLYNITIIDANACTSSTSVNITQPALLSASATSSSVVCNGGNSTIDVNAVGGTQPYTYTLNNGTPQSTSSFTNVAPGLYTINVTDANACSTQTVIAVTQPNPIVVSATYGTLPCNGSTTSVIASATGGAGTFTYTLNGGTSQASNVFTGVVAGTYTLVATDANSCSSSTVFTLTQPDALVLTASSSNALCNGGNGSLTFSAIGGTGTLAYTVNGVAQTSPYTTTAGTYTIAVSDANFCNATSVVTVTQPAAMVLTTNVNNAICNGSNGTITFNAVGGAGSITYTVNGAVQTSPYATIAGSYTIVASDANSCSVSSVVVITEPTPIVLSTANTNALCNGANGSLTFSATGGTGTISYTVNGASQTSPLNTIAGTYTIMATDANNCSNSTVVTISEPAAVVLTLNNTPIACTGGTSNLTASATGGNGILFYSLDGVNFQSSGAFNNLLAGTYTVTAKDGNNCSTSTVLTITQPTSVVLTANATDALCNGANGALNFNATGGTGTFNYTVNGTAQTSPYTTAAGTYTVVASDANACSTSTVLTIAEPTAVSLTATAANALCNSING
ncbi:MAG: beta-propeller fold lactonase family protein, partial [Chitinophagaceae bacterium]